MPLKSLEKSRKGSAHQPPIGGWWQIWTGSTKVPTVNDPSGTPDGAHCELTEIVSKLEGCLEASQSLGLSLLTALVDHALGEAKKHLE